MVVKDALKDGIVTQQTMFGLGMDRLEAPLHVMSRRSRWRTCLRRRPARSGGGPDCALPGTFFSGERSHSPAGTIDHLQTSGYSAAQGRHHFQAKCGGHSPRIHQARKVRRTVPS